MCSEGSVTKLSELHLKYLSLLYILWLHINWESKLNVYTYKTFVTPHKHLKLIGKGKRLIKNIKLIILSLLYMQF